MKQFTGKFYAILAKVRWNLPQKEIRNNNRYGYPTPGTVLNYFRIGVKQRKRVLLLKSLWYDFVKIKLKRRKPRFQCFSELVPNINCPNGQWPHTIFHLLGSVAAKKKKIDKQEKSFKDYFARNKSFRQGYHLFVKIPYRCLLDYGIPWGELDAKMWTTY